MKASLIRITVLVAVIGALSPPARSADITHKFLGVDNKANNLVYVDQTDAKNNWTTAIPGGSRDLQIIEGNKVLVSHGNGAGEYDLATGKKLWAIDSFKGVNTARRLPCGNTLLGAGGRGGIVIYTVDRTGKKLGELLLKGLGNLRLMRRLKNGNILLTVGKRVVEVDAKGKIVWEAKIPGKGYKAVRLPQGNTLVSTAGAVVIVEIDSGGKTVSSVGGRKNHPKLLLDCFSGFDTLKNGNVIVANWLGHGNIGKGKHLIEFDRNNKVVWTWGDHKAAKAITNMLLLDDVKQSAPAAAAAGDWQALFDGKTLDGWTNPYTWGKATVVDGEIHLTTTKRKFFLTTAKQYADFIFEVEVKMPEGKSNSGFMFRCHRKPNKVFGYQAEVDPSDRKWSGGLYDEGRRGWLYPNKKKKETIAAFRKKAGDSFKRNDWNKYRIECVGDNLKISVNGVQTTDFKDSVDAQGYLALQHHGEKGKIYRFRNIRVKVIKPAKE
ncbi:MAG: DUF1080 domain-containing protein [Phycisphaerae bacterium]|jgi:hypothetical protein|nr:DUF1080 domain-containing protein [Phycisphaerae bacterium]